MISTESFIILALTFRSVTHFEEIFNTGREVKVKVSLFAGGYLIVPTSYY